MTTHSEPKSTGLLGMVADALSRFWRRRSQINELRSLAPEELARIAQDSGVTPADLLALAKRDGESAELLYRRLRRLGIYPNALDRAVLRDMQRCCSQCDSKTLCVHELEDRPREATWPSYCPNKTTLDALMGMKCH